MRIIGTFWLAVSFLSVELWFPWFWKSILFWWSVKAYDQNRNTNDSQNNESNKNIHYLACCRDLIFYCIRSQWCSVSHWISWVKIAWFRDWEHIFVLHCFNYVETRVCKELIPKSNTFVYFCSIPSIYPISVTRTHWFEASAIIKFLSANFTFS